MKRFGASDEEMVSFNAKSLVDKTSYDAAVEIYANVPKTMEIIFGVCAFVSIFGSAIFAAYGLISPSNMVVGVVVAFVFALTAAGIASFRKLSISDKLKAG